MNDWEERPADDPGPDVPEIGPPPQWPVDDVGTGGTTDLGALPPPQWPAAPSVALSDDSYLPFSNWSYANFALALVAGIVIGPFLQIAVALLTYPLIQRFAEDDGPQQEIARVAAELSGAEIAFFASEVEMWAATSAGVTPAE